MKVKNIDRKKDKFNQRRKRLSDLKHFEKAKDKLITVDLREIELRVLNQVEEDAKSRIKDDGLIFELDKDKWKFHHKTYCYKTGKLLNRRQLKLFQNILKVHDYNSMFELLNLTSTRHVADEWLDTSSAKLNKLMFCEKIDYLCYAGGLVFDAENGGKKTDLELLKEKVKANENLVNLEYVQDWNGRVKDNGLSVLIIEINELLRKVLGLQKPTLGTLKRFYLADSLETISKNRTTLEIFRDNVKEHLIYLLKTHFKTLKDKNTSKYNKLYKVSVEDIKQVKKSLKGLSNFHQQAKIKNQNKENSILLDLKGFMFDEISSGSDNENDAGMEDLFSFESMAEIEKEILERDEEKKRDKGRFKLGINVKQGEKKFTGFKFPDVQGSVSNRHAVSVIGEIPKIPKIPIDNSIIKKPSTPFKLNIPTKFKQEKIK